MKKRILAHKARIVVFITLISACLTSAGWAASYYYVDAISGNDTSAGTQAAPWKTVAKVNGFALKAGDFVYFKNGGTWNEALSPKSGVNGSVITYGAYGSGSKPVIKNFYADNKSYIRLQDIEFRSKGADVPVLIYNGSNHISVNNCDIIADTSCTAYVALWLSFNVTYNEISNCYVAHNNVNIQNDTINLRRNANYNIIKNNSIVSGTHYGLALEGSDAANPTYTCSYNVIQNNTIQCPYGAGLSLISNANQNVVDGNTITGGKSSVHSNYLARSLKNVSKNNIVRRNIVKDNFDVNGSGISMEVYAYGSDPPNIATGNHTYNNVISGITGASAGYGPIVIASDGSAGAAAYNNYWKNNIIAGNTAAYPLWIMSSTAIHDNFFDNNIIYRSGSTNILHLPNTTTSVAGAQTSDPSHFKGNLQADPFLNADLVPGTSSSAIDGGASLTTISSATGSGTSFTVVDAGYFMDGFGIVTGDQIQVGNSLATIASIDYAKNLITVTSSISWVNGAPVNLPYSGSKPDIGAVEYNNTVPIILPIPRNLQ